MKKTLLMLCLAFFPGCLSTEHVETLDGTYILRSVNGKPLPYTVSESAGTKVELLDESYAIDKMLNFVLRAHVRTTVGGQTNTAEQISSGSVGSEGHYLKFRKNGGAEVIGEYKNEAFTVTAVGAQFVYTK